MVTCTTYRHTQISILTLILCLVFGLQTGQAQTKQDFPPELQQITKEKSTSEWMGFKEDTQIKPDELIQRKKALNLGADDQLIQKESQVDRLGINNHKYQQYYKGIPVEWAMFFIQEKNNRAQTAGGQIVRGLNLSVTPSISSQQALAKALEYTPAETYMWQDAAQEDLLKRIKDDPTATFMPTGDLLIANSQKIPNTNPDVYALTYAFDIHLKAPSEAYRVYVSALDGSLVKKVPLHRNCSAGQGQTLYNGNQNIDTEKLGNNNYRLFDDCRGQGVHTLKNNGFIISDVYDGDNNWPAAQAPYVSAHWASEKTYDYYLADHNRNSYDNAGGQMCSIVGGFCDNAFWNGVYTSYGWGCNLAHNYLVGLDVVGHEWTHAVTQYSAGLVYAYEPGALNESFSDIFGTLVEAYAENGGDYLLGEDFWIPNGKMRDLSNPKSKQQPDTYCGQFWYIGAGDNGGVHINSGVQNYWFYILAEGDAGVNDNGHAYNITGIGADKAAQIAYRNLTVYLGPYSTYQAAADGSVQAAADLYGQGSVEYNTTIEAWCAVGVNPSILGGTPIPPQKILGLVGAFWNGVCPNGANDGVLGVQGVGGYPGYLYEFNDPATGWRNSSGLENNLAAGTYTFRVTDTNFNTAYASLTLKEEDLINPIAVCRLALTVHLDQNGQGNINVNDVDGGSFDNCGIKERTLNIQNFNCNHIGNDVGVVLTVRDFANRIDQCVTRVTVLDNIKPTALCVPTFTTYVNNIITPDDIDAGSFDNCFIKHREVSPNSFAQPGEYTVTLTITDQSDNKSTCTTQVTVLCPGDYRVGDACDDYDACTYDDRIQYDCSCVGIPIECDYPYYCYYGNCQCGPYTNVGDPCDDYDDCTENDQIQEDCSCAGTPVTCPYNQSCYYGYCQCDNNTNPGDPCDDGDYCTEYDQIQEDCSCAGTEKYCPYPTTCDYGECYCPSGYAIGDSCDDGDYCTENDVIQSDCSCYGTQIICDYPLYCYDGYCSCPGGYEVGSSCDDGDPCTEGDSIQEDCSCYGTPIYCPIGETCVDGYCSCVIGELCDDGDPCTENDNIQSDCSCYGYPIYCPNGETCVDGNCTGDCTVGDSCDDGDPCTNGDSIQSDCSCAGTAVYCPIGETCVDGYCSCVIGEPCDDGDPCTENDNVQSDCSCYGYPIYCPNGETCVNGDCTGDCTTGDSCDDGDPCTEGDSVQSDCSCYGYPIYCPYGEICVDGNCSGDCTTGDSCDDGDPCTGGDSIQSDCSCLGVAILCPPGESCINGNCSGDCTMGDPCDNGNECTTGDTIQSDCSCGGGTPTECPPGEACQNGICTACTALIPCNDGDPCTTNDSYGSDCLCAGVAIACPPGETCVDGTCEGGGCIDPVGAGCDDGDDCTENDTVQSDCSCAGTVTTCPPGETCSNGLCSSDCGTGTSPGDPCDDGNPGTSGDVYQTDCLCAGAVVIGNPKPGYAFTHYNPIISVYPNPFEDILTIQYRTIEENVINIELLDILGRVVLRQEQSIFDGINEVVLSFDDRLTEGVYLLRIVDLEGNVAVEKVIHY